MTSEAPTGVLRMFGGAIMYAAVNFGALLRWALPVPLLIFLVFPFWYEPLPYEWLSPGDEKGGDIGGEMNGAEDSGWRRAAWILPTLFVFLLAMPLYLGVQRHMLLGAPLGSVPYVRTFASAGTWRYALLYFVVFVLIMFFLSFICGFITRLFMRLADMWELPFLGQELWFPAVVFSFPVWLLALFLWVKISLGPSLLARGESSPLRRSWRVSKGGLLRLTGLYVLFWLAEQIIYVPLGLMLGDRVEWGISAPLFLLYAIAKTFLTIFEAAVPCLYLRSVGLGPSTLRPADDVGAVSTAAKDAVRA